MVFAAALFASLGIVLITIASASLGSFSAAAISSTNLKSGPNHKPFSTPDQLDSIDSIDRKMSGGTASQRRTTEKIILPTSGIGTRHELLVHRYGSPGPGTKKIYIQATLHADELPGLLVAHHLIKLLDEASAKGEINAVSHLRPSKLGLGRP
jgi:Succinylglutamate desuccinylase / Aspartoacylase family